MSQEELIERCIKKDGSAWEEFIRKYQSLVRKAVYYRLHNVLRNDVDDIVQEVFLMLWKDDKLLKLRDTSHLKGWLVVVTFNLTASYGRLPCKRWKITRSIHERPANDKSITFEDLVTSSHPDPARSAEIKETISYVEKRIDTLKMEEKTALKLHTYDGQTQKDIAAIMNIPANTAASLIRRAKIRIWGGMME